MIYDIDSLHSTVYGIRVADIALKTFYGSRKQITLRRFAGEYPNCR
jgi:hypothetical protein